MSYVALLVEYLLLPVQFVFMLCSFVLLIPVMITIASAMAMERFVLAFTARFGKHGRPWLASECLGIKTWHSEKQEQEKGGGDAADNGTG